MMEKYYKLAEEKVIETVTTIPKEMWERKGLLPYEEQTETIFGEVNDKILTIEVLEDKVIGHITRIKIAPTLDELKQIKKDEIKMIYEDKSYSGFTCSNGIILDCRDSDKINWLSLKLTFQAYPDTKKAIKDFNNNLHIDLSAEEIMKMLSELEAYYNLLMSTKWTKEQEIYSCKSEEELNSIEWI